MNFDFFGVSRNVDAIIHTTYLTFFYLCRKIIA